MEQLVFFLTVVKTSSCRNPTKNGVVEIEDGKLKTIGASTNFLANSFNIGPIFSLCCLAKSLSSS